MRVGWRGAAGAENGSGLQTARGTGAFRARDVGAQGVKRIVGDEAAPDEAPEGIDRFAGIAAADGLMEWIEEAGAGGFEDCEKLFFALGERFDDGPLLREQGQLVGKEKCDAAIAFADGLDAGPGNFAGSNEGVEAGWSYPEMRAGRMDDSSSDAGIGAPCRLSIASRSASRCAGPLRRGASRPCQWVRKRASVCCSTGSTSRRSLGEGFAADLAQDFGIAPLAMKTAGAEAAFEHAALVRKQAESVFDDGGVEGKTVGGLAQRERTVGASEAADEFKHRLGDRLEKRGGQAGRQRNAEGIAVAGGIFGGDQAAFAGNAQFEQAAGADQAVDGFEQQFGRGDAAGEFFAGQIAEAQAEIVDAVGSAGAVILGQALGGLFHFGDGVGIEQFAQVGFAEKFAELILIDGEGLGAALGQGRVAVVEEVGDVAEQQRRGKGRRLARFDNVDAKLALLDGAQSFDQRGHVEEVAQALAVGLEQQRKRRIARGHAEQIVGALAQLPEGRALIGAPARQQKGAAGGLAKTAGKERGGAELAQDELHGFGGLDEEPVGIGRLVGVGKAEDEAVVAPEGFDFGTAGRRGCGR